MKKIKQLYFYIKKKGLNDTIQRIYLNYCHIQSFILYEQSLDDNFLGISLEPEFKCIKGNIDLLNKIRKNRKDLPREFYIDESHGGNFFYLVYCQKEVAYIHWIFRKGEYSRFFDIHDDKTVEFNYNFTLPKFRGNRLQAKTMNYISKELKAKGYKKTLGAVASTNILSKKGMNRTGHKEFKIVNSYFSYVKKTKIEQKNKTTFL